MPLPAISAKSLHSLKRIIGRMPPMPGATFADFLKATQSHLVQLGDPKWVRTAKELSDPALASAKMMPVFALVASQWARQWRRAERSEALSSLIRHPTINASNAENPGRSPAFDAFEADLKSRAEKLGLVFSHTEHVAYAIAPLEGADIPLSRRVAVLVHGDVVPAAEPGWEVDPFEGVVTHDRIVGRGALDDKGPLVALLYAMAALSQSGLPFKAPPTLIVGTSEETHWHGIDRFLEVHGKPGLIFVADGAFPVGIGEKGISNVRVTSDPTASAPAPKNLLRLESLKGGQVSNQVPATAEAVVAISDPESRDALAKQLRKALVAASASSSAKITLSERGDEEFVIQVKGQSAHGASPQKGVNAISPLLRVLNSDLPWHRTPCVDLLALLDTAVGDDLSGGALGLAMKHPEFSDTTVNLGLLNLQDDGACQATLNVRWPPPAKPEAVVAAVEKSLHTLAQRQGRRSPTVKGGGLAPFYIPPDDPLVDALRYTYSSVTGRDATPRTISGTTYSKAVPGAVTFGPGSEATRSKIHAPNEYLEMSAFDEMVETYSFALLLLSSAESAPGSPAP
jgi:succinyl-diaminopimelate desuccinylase